MNVVVGGNPIELAGDGIFLDHGQRYAQAREIPAIWKRLLSRRSAVRIRPFISTLRRRPEDLALDATDLYLTWGEPMDQVKEKLDAARAKAAQRSRTIRFGMRIHFIVWENQMTHGARPTG